jgi:splicing factor 3B subunit 3
MGDIITALQRSVMVAGGREVLLYVTLNGTIGMFVPFASREDVEFFQMLEMQMRNEAPSICGRDHLAYRSYYFPVKNIVDGNLVEQYHRLPAEKKRQIAEEMERTTGDIARQIELIRTRVF